MIFVSGTMSLMPRPGHQAIRGAWRLRRISPGRLVIAEHGDFRGRLENGPDILVLRQFDLRILAHDLDAF